MRQKVTLSALIFELVNKLKDNQRLVAYDQILTSLFYNKEINYDGLSDEVVNVLIVAKYELKKIKTNYENGCVEKTFNNADPFACLKKGSEKKRKKATKKQENSSDYNSNIYKYINNINQSVNQGVFDNKTKKDLLALVEMAKSIAKLEPVGAKRMLKSVERLTQVNEINIAGEAKKMDNVVTQIADKLQPLSKEELACELQNLISRVDANRVNDKVNYFIASLYNLKPMHMQTTQNSSCKMYTRNLTKEQLDSVLDRIDEIEI